MGREQNVTWLRGDMFSYRHFEGQWHPRVAWWMMSSKDESLHLSEVHVSQASPFAVNLTYLLGHRGHVMPSWKPGMLQSETFGSYPKHLSMYSRHSSIASFGLSSAVIGARRNALPLEISLCSVKGPKLYCICGEVDLPRPWTLR